VARKGLQAGKHADSVSTVQHGPFSRRDLNAIFKVSTKHKNRLASRESSWLEFKKSFNWGSRAKYARTCAAFANAKGGYIVFGVAEKPHTMVGLRSKNFEEIDAAKVTEYFNENLSPEILWEPKIYEFREMQFGLFYVHECREKPVICTKTHGEKQELKEGSIYYRYRGQSKNIGYPELRAIFDERTRREQMLWLQHLKQIARVGVQEAGVFDLSTGSVRGPGGTFILDESLLDRVSFIREGEFREHKGVPAVRIVGEAKIVEPGILPVAPRIVKTKGIRTDDIVNAFLENAKVPEPGEYVRQVCFESTAFLPVYHFMRQANLSRRETADMLEGVQSRQQSRKKLIQRLRSDDDLSLEIPKTRYRASKDKQDCRELLLSKGVNADYPTEKLWCVCQAIRMLTPDEIKPRYIRPLLKTWFNKYYTSNDAKLADNMRRAICYLDSVLNRSATNDA